MTETTDALAEFKALSKNIKTMREEQKKVAQTAFHDGAKTLFERYGDIVAEISWTQYTPYFNDGEPCVFRASTDYAAIISVEEKASVEEGSHPHYDSLRDLRYDEGGATFSKYSADSKVSEKYGQIDPRYVEALGAINLFLGTWDEQSLEDLFGDHAQVIMTRDGVDVEEYDHE